MVAPSKQIKVADSELLTEWERKRQVGVRREGGLVQADSFGKAVCAGGLSEHCGVALRFAVHAAASCMLF